MHCREALNLHGSKLFSPKKMWAVVYPRIRGCVSDLQKFALSLSKVGRTTIRRIISHSQPRRLAYCLLQEASTSAAHRARGDGPVCAEIDRSGEAFAGVPMPGHLLHIRCTGRPAALHLMINSERWCKLFIVDWNPPMLIVVSPTISHFNLLLGIQFCVK